MYVLFWRTRYFQGALPLGSSPGLCHVSTGGFKRVPNYPAVYSAPPLVQKFLDPPSSQNKVHQSIQENIPKYSSYHPPGCNCQIYMQATSCCVNSLSPARNSHNLNSMFYKENARVVRRAIVVHGFLAVSHRFILTFFTEILRYTACHF